ncbi:MAG: tape measure protein, partial [Rhodospirillales bacterium]
MAVTRLETRLTARDDTARAFRSLKANLATVDRAFVNVTKVAAGLGTVFGGLFVRDLVKVNKNFQSLQASLITFTGSTQNASAAFDILKEFAKTTPFSLDEVVGSFNILLAQGIKPTEKQLRNFADIAGGSSKSILQFAEAVADASVGEFERLKEFGIKTKKEGEKLTFSIGDFTKQINNDSDSILAALAEIGQTKFAGGAERQAATLGGAFTNLRDTVDEFMFQVGEAGLSRELANTVRSMTAVVGGNNELAKSFSDAGVKAIRYFVDAIRFMRNNLETLFNVFRVVFGALVVRAIINLGMKFLFLGKIVTSVTVAFGALNRAIFLIPAIVAAAIGATAALIGKFDSLKNGISDAVKEADEYLGVTETAKQLTDRLGLSTLLTTDAFNQFKNENVDLNGVIEKNVESLKNIYDRMGNLKKATDDTFGAGAKKGIEE